MQRKIYVINETTKVPSGAEPGTRCWEKDGPDFGLCRDDDHGFPAGSPHRMMTANGREGFTVPERRLDYVETIEFPPPDETHVKEVCKSGQGADCCRYLISGPKGFGCAKQNFSLSWQIEARIFKMEHEKEKGLPYSNPMTALGDNCEGRASE